jgi:cell pole-organizing protein PopZ
MEEILASIRRILNEEPVPDGATTAEPDDGVLVLDKSMMLESSAPDAAAEPAAGEPEEAPMADPEPPRAAVSPPAEDAPPAERHAPAAKSAAAADLVAPEAAAAAAMAMGNLMRTLAVDRRPKVWSDGPTLEDLVRVTLRPLLKEWLDENLPPLVERLVRVEIERVVGRVIP